MIHPIKMRVMTNRVTKLVSRLLPFSGTCRGHVMDSGNSVADRKHDGRKKKDNQSSASSTSRDVTTTSVVLLTLLLSAAHNWV